MYMVQDKLIQGKWCLQMRALILNTHQLMYNMNLIGYGKKNNEFHGVIWCKIQSMGSNCKLFCQNWPGNANGRGFCWWWDRNWTSSNICPAGICSPGEWQFVFIFFFFPSSKSTNLSLVRICHLNSSFFLNSFWGTLKNLWNHIWVQ